MKKWKCVYLSLQVLSIVAVYLMTCCYPLLKPAVGPMAGGDNVASVPWRDKENQDNGVLLSNRNPQRFLATNSLHTPMFQRVNQYDAWIFSAFFDTHYDMNVTRIFGIQDYSIDTPIYCHLLDRRESVVVVNGTRTFIKDIFRNRFLVVSYECDVRHINRPFSVSLTFNKSDPPSNHLQVFYSPPLQRNFTVCHAVFFNFRNFLQIVQSFEFDLILGAEHFFLYNISVSRSTDAVLRHYQKLGLLTVIQWALPISDIHYYGQLLAINDCVYRNRGVSRFVVVKDTDELIVPHRHGSWAEVISATNGNATALALCHGAKPATYIFESTFFQWKPKASEWALIKKNYSIRNEEEAMFERYTLTSMMHLGRMKSTFGRKRTKVIVRPELVLLSHVHDTHRHCPLACRVNVDPRVAIVHHHRRFKDSILDNQTETSTLRFKVQLLSRVNRTMCNLRF